MELSRFGLIISVFFISFYGILLSDIPPTSSQKELLTGNPQRNLEEKTDNYILIIYGNYSSEIRLDKPLKSLEHYFDVTYNKIMEPVEIIDFNHFDSSEVENINYMFAGCKSLKSVKFGRFSTQKVTTMNSVFLNCESLTSLDLSYFDTRNVKDTSSMFKNCKSLAYLDISNFDLQNVDKDDSMFDGLDSLTYINLENAKDKGNGILKMEEKLSDRKGLAICRNGYTNPVDSFIYCCDYSFEGNIGAGKTTIMKIIGQHFTSVEFVEEPVSQWQNLGGMNLLDAFYSDPQRWGFSFEFFSMLSKIKALLNAANSDKPVIVIERSILSNKVFMDLSHELGKLEEMEYRMLLNTYDFYLQHVYPQLSGIIYLDTPVDECIKRITKRNRGEECSIERSYLQSLKEKMDEVANSSTMKVIRIDGMYDCERDKVRVCQDMESYLNPNEENKIFG